MNRALIRVNVGQYVWYKPSVCVIVLCVLTGLYRSGVADLIRDRGLIATIGKFSR